MRIHGLVVSVNYADCLALSIGTWQQSLTSLTVVTDSKDTETAALAQRFGANTFITDVFYERGAKFNKGAAMEAARKVMPWQDWCLMFDADVIPEPHWLAVLEGANITPGALYGARRFQAAVSIKEARQQLAERRLMEFIKQGARPIADAPCDGGYFHLFHTSDPVVQVPPGADLLETCWSHAGVYDSKFKMRWPGDKWKVSPVQLVHIGERENWTGRGDREGMKQLLADRAKRGGGWASVEYERLK